MYRKTIEYKDFNGTVRNETFYFHFGIHELIDLEWRTPGGIKSYMEMIIQTQDGQKLADIFKWLIDQSYGVKSPDGRSFIKNQDVLNNFKFTNAYEKLYLSLATDDKAASEFVNGVFPKEDIEEAIKQKEMAEKAGLNKDQYLGEATQSATVTPFVPQAAPVAPVAPVYTNPVPPVEGQVFTPQGPTIPLQ